MTDTTDRTSVPDPLPVPPLSARDFRSELSSGEDVVDPEHWTGSVPVAHGIAPRVRIGQSRWFNHEFFGYRQSL